MKKLLILLVATLALTSCDPSGNEPTDLRLQNESLATLTNVVWNNVDFTDEQDITTGANVTRAVTAG